MLPASFKRFVSPRLRAFGWGEISLVWPRLLLLTFGFAALASMIYLQAGMGRWSPQFEPIAKTVLLSVGFFVLPSLVEELLWRWTLIPPTCLGKINRRSLLAIGMSTILFTAAHPIAALIFVPHAQQVFFSPSFIVIVFLLGRTCGIAYVWSKSIWPPTVIHWMTVLAWKFLLGGPFILLGR